MQDEAWASFTIAARRSFGAQSRMFDTMTRLILQIWHLAPMITGAHADAFLTTGRRQSARRADAQSEAIRSERHRINRREAAARDPVPFWLNPDWAVWWRPRTKHHEGRGSIDRAVNLNRSSCRAL